MFLLMSGMAEALHTTDIKEKMEIMLKSSGISITITSFTDLLAFGIGATSAFVSIRNFCIYTGNLYCMLWSMIVMMIYPKCKYIHIFVYFQGLQLYFAT